MAIASRLLSPALALAALTAGSLSAQAQTTVVGNFYRQADRPAVMYQYRNDLFCHVQNETQMAAYGGFPQVIVVPRMAMRGRQTGTCAWPNGFYRRNNEAAVYRLYEGGAICHVVDGRQMAAFGGFKLVKVVQPNSDLARGRGPVSPCNTRAG